MASSSAERTVDRRRQWQEILRRWRASGLSQAEFCRRHGIPAWKLAWWKRRLREGPLTGMRCGAASEEQPSTQAPFMPVGIVTSSSGFELELALHCGRVLRFDGAIETAKLAAIVAAVEAVTC